jgi:hypothetical protein
MKDPATIFQKDYDVIPWLLEELAPLLAHQFRPSVGALTLQSVRRGQAKHRQSEQGMHRRSLDFAVIVYINMII